LERQNITSKTMTMNSTMARRTYPTVLRVDFLCLDDEELLSRAVAPPEVFAGVLGCGGAPEVGDEDDGVCVGVEALESVGVKEGEVEGVVLVLNGLPSFL
jgi:hypothetical protein